MCNEKITISVISILLIFSGLLVNTCCLYLYHIVAYGVPILFLYNNYNNIFYSYNNTNIKILLLLSVIFYIIRFCSCLKLNASSAATTTTTNNNNNNNNK